MILCKISYWCNSSHCWIKSGDISICAISYKLSWKNKYFYELSKKGSIFWSSFSSGVGESAPKLVQCKYDAKVL